MSVPFTVAMPAHATLSPQRAAKAAATRAWVMHCGSLWSSRGDDDVTDRHASVGHGHLLQGGTETGRDIQRGAAAAPRGVGRHRCGCGVQRSGSSLAQRPIWPPAVGLPTATPRSGRLLRDRDRRVADRALPKLTDNRLIAYGSAAVISERRADELRRRCAIAHP